MSTLVAILGTGKGTWFEVHKLIELRAFDKIVLFIDAWAAPSYKNEYDCILIPLPEDGQPSELVNMMSQHLKAVTSTDFDLAINIASGTGKQHAALLSAALKLGLGVRLVTLENGNLNVLC